MICEDEHQAQITHLAKLAMNPGMKDHAKHRSMELEKVWPGITDEVRAEIQRIEKGMK